MPYDDHDFDGTCLAPGCDNLVPEPTPRKRTRTYANESEPDFDMRTKRDQRRTCSNACRTALSRARREKARPLVTCQLCGQPFMPRGRGRWTVCPYEDADNFCRERQDDREDAQSMRTAALAEAECEHCQTPIPYSGRGRPKRFCAPRCRTAFYRATKGAAK
ncbi:hypothetical protein GCM10022206_49190 [Streptomyces chiangmaiensis]